jgi:hypothetical protein
MPWPHTIPADLRRRLAGVLSTRNHGPAEVWGGVRDWLEKHGVEVPEGFTPEEEARPSANRDQ